MPNSKRGEVEIDLDGKNYIMRFTLGAMRELKEAFGKPLKDYFQENAENIDPEDIVKIFHAGLKAGGNELSIEQIEDAMVMPRLAEYVDIMARGFGFANAADADEKAKHLEKGDQPVNPPVKAIEH